MPIHRRSPSLILPDDPSSEELLQCCTLSARDRIDVLRCRGDANRRRYAVQGGFRVAVEQPTPVFVCERCGLPAGRQSGS